MSTPVAAPSERTRPQPSVVAALLVLVAALLASLVAASGARAEVGPPEGKGTRIVGGSVAPAGAWPSQVGLLSSTTTDTFDAQFCGGTAINRNWVLTAAHCVADAPRLNPPIDILTGTQTLGNGTGTRHRVVEIVLTNFDADTFSRDVALLRVRKPFPLTVPSQALVGQGVAVPGGTSVTATGWGSLASEGSYPTQLMQVALPMQTDGQCGSAYGAGYQASVMICAGVVGKDTCQGDSGGPLVLNDGGTWKQVGITSFGEGCGSPGYPGVYTRVSAFNGWINGQARYGPHSNAAAFADQLHRDLYNRVATPAERSTLTANVSVSGWTSERILGSANQARAGAVARLYSAFFLRDPDTGGLAYWWGQVNAGKSLKWIANVMATSSEFQNRYGSLTDSAYIDLVYSNVLGRPADGAGRSFWLSQLSSGARSRGEMMVGFSESSEYRNAKAARINVIITYFELLRRVPTPSELTADLPTSNPSLVIKLLQSYSYALRFA